ncbi:LPXTG cell wall anchor domain-containing protein [Erwinia sp. CPCC 100877]|nr:LPXTG cell wall anchor domain-containing protein [Erwinia sp. CPCC 100877]
MKRINGILVLGLLSLFLGVTTVTSYAQSVSSTVEVGITFTEDGSNDNGSNSGAGNNSSSEDPTTGNSEGQLPQTGENTSPVLKIVGILCLGLLFYLIKRSSKKELK